MDALADAGLLRSAERSEGLAGLRADLGVADEDDSTQTEWDSSSRKAGD
jgi:hypothetical protein